MEERRCRKRTLHDKIGIQTENMEDNIETTGVIEEDVARLVEVIMTAWGCRLHMTTFSCDAGSSSREQTAIADLPPCPHSIG